MSKTYSENLVEELLKEFQEIPVEETEMSSFMGTNVCCNKGSADKEHTNN